MDYVRAHRPARELRVFERLIAWSPGQGLQDGFFRGPKGFQFMPELRAIRPVNLHARAEVRLNMCHLKHYPPFDDTATGLRLLEGLSEIPDFRMGAGVNGFPTIPVRSLEDDTEMSVVQRVLDDVVAALR